MVRSSNGKDLLNKLKIISGKIAAKAEKIYWFGPINEKVVAAAWHQIEYIRQLSDNPDKEIVIYLKSNGGDPYAALAFYELVRINNVNLKVVATGMVASAGIIIMLAAKKIAITENSYLLLHGGSLVSPYVAPRDIEEIEREKRVIDNINKQVEKLLAKRIDSQLAKRYCRKEAILDAKAAKEVGLVDEII